MIVNRAFVTRIELRLAAAGRHRIFPDSEGPREAVYTARSARRPRRALVRQDPGAKISIVLTSPATLSDIRAQDRVPPAHLARRRPHPVARSRRRRPPLARLPGARPLPLPIGLHLHADAHHQLHQRCVAQCDYCAFYKLPGQEGGYVLSHDQVFAKLDELLALGGDLAGFNGGFNPHLPLDYYCDLSGAIRARYGDRLEFYALTIAEFMYLADHAKLDYADAAARFKAAGVRWITGGGSEILTEDFRARHSKFKYTVAQYFEAQRALVDAGLRTSATMVIGFDETIEERIEHLESTRAFQDQVLASSHPEALASFLCWTFKPWFTALLGGIEISTGEYLRHLALSRIYLDNIPRIRTSVLTQNERALEGLLYGADDFDLPIEDEVTQLAGATISLNFDKLLAAARTLGFTPTYRHVAPGWNQPA